MSRASELMKVMKITEGFKITGKKLAGSGGLWVDLDDGKHRIQALVFGDKHSDFGINGGNISKLWIKDKALKKQVFNYDRGDDHDEAPPGLVDSILKFLAPGSPAYKKLGLKPGNDDESALGDNEGSTNEEDDVKEIIKDLINTNFSADDDAKGKAAQLMRGLFFSDDPAAQKFIKELDTATNKFNPDDFE